MVKKAIFSIIAVLVLAMGSSVAFAGDNSGQYPDGTPYTNSTPNTNQYDDGSGTTPPQQTANRVAIRNFAFVPANINVPVGTTVTWTNFDRAPHNVTGDNGIGPKSDTLRFGQSYSFTFSQPGTYHYRCTLHLGMLGTVTVGGRGSSTDTAQSGATTTTPSTTQPSTDETTGATNTNRNENVNINVNRSDSNASASATSDDGVSTATPSPTTHPNNDVDTNDGVTAPTTPAPTVPAQPAPVTTTADTNADGPSVLPNTGAGQALAAALVATLLGTGASYLYIRRKHVAS